MTQVMLRGSYATIPGGGLNQPLNIPNPAVTTGSGVLFKHSAQPWVVDVPAAGKLELMHLNFRNTHPTVGDGSLFYGFTIVTDSDAVDTAAGLAIFNNGHSDAIYINAAGKPGSVETPPTGLGIDLNKGGGGGQNSSNHHGFGIQVYDWSTSNMGVDGPTCVFLTKVSNVNTDHLLLEMSTNRYAWRVITPRGSGYDHTAPLTGIWRGDTGGQVWIQTAGGNQYFIAPNIGLSWQMASGNYGTLASNHTTNTLDITMPAGGLRVLKNDGSKAFVELLNNGQLSIRLPDTTPAFVVNGGAEVYGLAINNGLADGGDLSLMSQGSPTWTLDNLSGLLRFVSGGVARIAADAAGGVYINDSSNVFQTRGLTINQGTADDEIITFKSTDVAHGITDSTETDTFGRLLKYDGPSGGMSWSGLSSATVGLHFRGLGITGVTTKATNSLAYVMIDGAIKSGTGPGEPGANENLLAVRSRATVRFILDADGDSHQDVGTAWTNFDTHDDPLLLTALSAGVSQPGDPLREQFGAMLESHREELEQLGLVTFNPDGHHFINWSRTNMVVIGAVRQLASRLERYEQALLSLGINPTMIGED